VERPARSLALAAGGSVKKSLSLICAIYFVAPEKSRTSG
jgi:hypothetical protein